MARDRPHLPPGLLDAILAAPEDDAPRLVCADWLEEQGDADRAALVRLQCRAARPLAHGLTPADALAAHREAAERVRLHPEWLAPLRRNDLGPQGGATFRRGFLDLLTVARNRPPTLLNRLLEANPLLRQLRFAPKCDLSYDDLSHLPLMPNLRLLAAPRVAGVVSERFLRRLCEYPRLHRVTLPDRDTAWGDPVSRLRRGVVRQLDRLPPPEARALALSFLADDDAAGNPSEDDIRLTGWPDPEPLARVLGAPRVLAVEASRWHAVAPLLTEPSRLERLTLDPRGPADWSSSPQLATRALTVTADSCRRDWSDLPAALEKCPALERLTLAGPPLMVESLPALAACARLRELRLAGYQGEPGDLAPEALPASLGLLSIERANMPGGVVVERLWATGRFGYVRVGKAQAGRQEEGRQD